MRFTINQLALADNRVTSVLYNREDVITPNRDVNMSMQENRRRKGFDPLGCDHRQQKEILNKSEITRIDCWFIPLPVTPDTSEGWRQAGKHLCKQMASLVWSDMREGVDGFTRLVWPVFNGTRDKNTVCRLASMCHAFADASLLSGSLMCVKYHKC